MPRGRRSSYVRDWHGRFASTPGGSRPAGKGKPAKAAGPARAAGPASPVKPKAKGAAPPRLRGSLPARRKVAAAKGKLQAMDPADQSIKASLSRRSQKGAVTKAKKKLAAAKEAGTVRMKGLELQGRLRKGKATKPRAVTPEVMPRGSERVPARDRPGSMAHTLRSTLRELAQLDAKRIREIEAITGTPIGAPKSRSRQSQLPGTGAQASRGRNTSGNRGEVTNTLGTSLRELAQSDARFARGLAEIVSDATPKLAGSKGKGGKAVKGGTSKALEPGRDVGDKPKGRAAEKKSPKLSESEQKNIINENKSIAQSSTKRSKPADTIMFDSGGIKGPTGAKLKAYTWSWEWGTGRNREGDEVDKRVSNWKEAEPSSATGRNVVHKFIVEKNGITRTVSSEGALKELGFLGEGQTAFKGLKSALRTQAQLRVREAELTRKQNAAMVAFEKAKLPKTRVSIEKLPNGKEQYIVKAGQIQLRDRTVGGSEYNKNNIVDSRGKVTNLGRLIGQIRSRAVLTATGGYSLAQLDKELAGVRRRIQKQKEKISTLQKNLKTS